MSKLGWKDVSDFSFNTILLFEEIQLSWLPRHRMSKRDFATALKGNPAVGWYIRNKCPRIIPWLDSIVEEIKDEPYPSADELRRAERAIIGGMEDWVLYVTEPETYDQQRFLTWDDEEIRTLTDFRGKIVADIGAGTGRLTFIAAPEAKAVMAVEPVWRNRQFIRDKAATLGHHHVFPIDGLIEKIPLPDDSVDIVMAGHVLGDYPEQEMAELRRVTKHGGMIISYGDRYDLESESHQFMLKNGFQWGRFVEPGYGEVFKYWAIVNKEG